MWTTIYVTRENATPKEVIPFINSLYKDKRLPAMYLVINDVNTLDRSKRYGYKYKYGYGYDYDYNQDKKKK